MIEFLAAQPAEWRDQVWSLINAETVEMAVMMHLDFKDQPLFLSNRNVAFRDPRWGHKWGAGSGLLVSLPDISGGEAQLAPFREYSLGFPNEWMDGGMWGAGIVEFVGDHAQYRSRDVGLYGQLFSAGQPTGWPFAFDVGLMDKLSVSFQRGGALVSITVEGFMSRKGSPVYGMQTYFDQKRRHPTDEGLQFVTESGNLITWTDW